MRKIRIVLFLLLSYSGLAQSKLRLGFNLGVNYVDYRGTSILDNTKSVIGYNGGAIIEYKLNERFSIKSGLSFQNKELEYNQRYPNSGYYMDEYGQLVLFDNSFDIKTINAYKFLSLPLLLNYNFTKNKSFFINSGFFITNLVGYKAQTKRTDKSNNVTEINNDGSFYNFLFADSFYGFDYGISFGIGKKINLKDKSQISIEFRDDFGGKNIIGGYSNNGVSGSIRPNAFYLITSWSIDFDKKKMIKTAN
jgi:hypothetical protein